MTRRWTLLAALVGGCLALGVAATPGQAPANKAILLNVGQGQLPPDTGQDDKTKPEIVANVPELGGKAMKVAFAPGDSFGAKAGAHKNWKPFAQIRFDALNPSKAP